MESAVSHPGGGPQLDGVFGGEGATVVTLTVTAPGAMVGGTAGTPGSSSASDEAGTVGGVVAAGAVAAADSVDDAAGAAGAAPSDAVDDADASTCVMAPPLTACAASGGGALAVATQSETMPSGDTSIPAPSGIASPPLRTSVTSICMRGNGGRKYGRHMSARPSKQSDARVSCWRLLGFFVSFSSDNTIAMCADTGLKHGLSSAVTGMCAMSRPSDSATADSAMKLSS